MVGRQVPIPPDLPQAFLGEVRGPINWEAGAREAWAQSALASLAPKTPRSLALCWAKGGRSATLTWMGFWEVAAPGVMEEVEGQGKTPEEIYQEALRRTKQYMLEIVWPELERLWDVTW